MFIKEKIEYKMILFDYTPLVQRMKRLISVLFLFSVLTACISKPIVKIEFNSDTNFQQFTSYQFSPETNITVDTNPIMIHRIQTAVDNALIFKGLTKHEFINKHSADITIQVNFNQQEKQNDSSFSIDLGTSMMGGNSRSGIGISTNIPLSSEADIITKIIIDMSDANQVIWHGSDIYVAKDNLSIEQTNEAVNTTVSGLLTHFPPEKSQ